MSKNVKPVIVVVFAISAICAIMTKQELLKYVFGALAFLVIGVGLTMEYMADKQKKLLYFSIMFYIFCVSSLVAAYVAMAD